ncbi:MAG: hypothetical protein GY754_11255 [bacterium]|nr:hypothetical protein [bacterium]
MIGGEPFQQLYHEDLYLRGEYHFRQRKINKKNIPPFSEEYFKLMADVAWIEDYHIKINGLESDSKA